MWSSTRTAARSAIRRAPSDWLFSTRALWQRGVWSVSVWFSSSCLLLRKSLFPVHDSPGCAHDTLKQRMESGSCPGKHSHSAAAWHSQPSAASLRASTPSVARVHADVCDNTATVRLEHNCRNCGQLRASTRTANVVLVGDPAEVALHAETPAAVRARAEFALRRSSAATDRNKQALERQRKTLGSYQIVVPVVRLRVNALALEASQQLLLARAQRACMVSKRSADDMEL